MNPQFAIYAKQLSFIGGQIKEATNVQALKPNNYEEALQEIQSYKNSVHNMRIIISEMEGIKPPTNVKADHQRLLDDLKEFLSGIELADHSVNIENQTFSKEKFVKGLCTIDVSKCNLIHQTNRIGILLAK